jgi:hypothetical protein
MAAACPASLSHRRHTNIAGATEGDLCLKSDDTQRPLGRPARLTLQGSHSQRRCHGHSHSCLNSPRDGNRRSCLGLLGATDVIVCLDGTVTACCRCLWSQQRGIRLTVRQPHAWPCLRDQSGSHPASGRWRASCTGARQIALILFSKSARRARGASPKDGKRECR